jgi:AcrR family transcriptional regulator
MKKTGEKAKPEKSARGRPREFDRESAVRIALGLFLERGYEGTGIADLVGAMNITPPSLYAAFGSKEGLFKEAIDLFFQSRGWFVTSALAEEKTAKKTVNRILLDAAKAFTPTGGEAHGCIVSAQLIACNPSTMSAASHVKDLRAALIAAIVRRFEQAKKDGELPDAVNCKALARFYAAALTGMAVQASDGASRRELMDLAENAMHAWPGR